MKLTYRDLLDLQSLARTSYIDQPVEMSIPGQPPGRLPERERRALAWFEAALKLLGRKGEKMPEGELALSGERKSVWEE